MSKMFKIILGIALVILVVFGGAIAYLSTAFDPNDYKTEITDLVKSHTGLDLIISGDLSLSVFPWLGVSVEGVSINSATGPLASISVAKVATRLMPLLKGDVQIKGLTLEDSEINWIIDESGKTMLDMEQTESPQSAGDSDPAGAASLAALTIGNIRIKNANITYHDKQAGQFHQVQGLDLSVKDASLNSSFPVKGQFNYRNRPDAVPLAIRLDAQVKADAATQTINLSETLIQVNNARLIVDADITSLAQTPSVKATIKLENLRPAEFAQLLDQPDLAGMTLALQIEADFELDTARDTLQLSRLDINSKQLQASGKLAAASLSNSPTFNGQLQIKPFNLQVLLTELGIPPIDTADPLALQEISANMLFNGTDKSLIVTQLKLGMDKTRAEGDLRINNFEKPKIVFNLVADTLNLDNYLPPPVAENTKSGSPATVAEKTDPNVLLLPVALLRDLNVTSQIKLGQLTASELVITNLDLQLVSAKGLIELKQLSGELYEGTFTAQGTVDARKDTPTINLAKKISGVHIGPMLTHLAEIDSVTGVLNLDAKINSRGNTQASLTKNLQGNVAFNISDGMLKAINLDKMVCQGLAIINQAAPKESPQQSPDTAFSSVQGDVQIRDGVISGDALNIALNNLAVKGSGTTDLVKEQLDYRLTAKLHGDLEDMACSVNERYRDIDWPIRCRGDFSDDPADFCRLDSEGMQKIIAQLAQREIKRKVGKKLEEQFGDRLKGLFNQ